MKSSCESVNCCVGTVWHAAISAAYVHISHLLHSEIPNSSSPSSLCMACLTFHRRSFNYVSRLHSQFHIYFGTFNPLIPAVEQNKCSFWEYITKSYLGKYLRFKCSLDNIQFFKLFFKFLNITNVFWNRSQYPGQTF